MKPTRLTTLLVIALVSTLAATGCKKTPVKVTDIYGTKARPINDDTNSLTPITPEPGASSTNLNSTYNPNEPKPMAGPERFAGMTPNAEIFKADAVYFDFDSSTVKAGEKPKAGHVADYLKDQAHANDAVRIAGNCDERGTEEYNRALGERRALALREVLISLGIDASRIDTISYGKDKPVAEGHNEEAWRQNRRGDFILLTPPGAQ